MKEFWRNLCAFLVVVLMCIVARQTGERDIIFPELAALCIGLWVVPKQVWHVGKLQLPIIMTLSATIGVLLNQQLPSLNFSILVLIGFVGVALASMALGVYVPPAFAACILPILTDIRSLNFLWGVLAMSIIVVLGQDMMKLVGIRPQAMPVYASPKWPNKKVLRRWSMILASLLPLVIVSGVAHLPGMLVPPLIVTLVEFSMSGSGFRTRPWQVLFLLVFASMLGSFLVLLSHEAGLPIECGALLAYMIMLGVFGLFSKSYAPAAAMSLIALVLPISHLWYWLVEVFISGAYVILVSAFPYLSRSR